MSTNPFLYDAEHYKRSISPISHWAEQVAWYASKMKGLPYEQCLAHIKKKLEKNEVPMDDPTVVFFHRGENGDSHKKTASLKTYLTYTLRSNHILAPSGTTYLHPSTKKSKIAGILDKNVIRRSILKKKSQELAFKKEHVLSAWYNRGQDNRKRSSNSVTGNFVAQGTAIRNPSAHSTVTSTTRCLASFSNASNERILSGTRDYHKPEIIYNNLASIAVRSDYELIDRVMRRLDIVVPTVDQTMACIQRSSNLYFRDSRKIREIRTLVERMAPLERAAFVYTGDLYQLMTLNETMMRTFITKLAAKGDPVVVDDVRAKTYAFDEMVVNYAHQYHMTMMAGKGKDYNLLTDDEMYQLYGTCVSIFNVIQEYRDLLQAFFLTENHPASIATMPDFVRRSVPLSDTDSTLFSVDNWVAWYFHGDYPFNDDGYAVGGAISYLATQCIAHILAHFSANMNVEKERIFSLAMKPEFFFPVFCQTSVSKHYFTAQLVKEGGVFEKIKMEIKGVHLKDSTVTKEIIKQAHARMETIITTIMAGNKISLNDLIEELIEIEQGIAQSILKGESKYLRRIRLKDRDSYKNVAEEGDIERSNYRHYTLWQRAFAGTYGKIPPPPYLAITVPLDLPNRTVVAEWLNGLENRDFADNFRGWLDEHNMVKIGAIHLPIDYCRAHGVPKELHPVIDIKRSILALTKAHRNILESAGFFPKFETTLSEMYGVPLTP